jgi:hypothetical protein
VTLELENVRVHQPYTLEIVETALLTFAATGNYKHASELVGIPDDTIRDWHIRFPNRYQRLAEKHAGEIEKTIATKVRQTVMSAATALDKAVALEEKRLGLDDVKDASASARNLATVMGIGVTKILELEGRPTSIVEHRSGAEALRAAEALGFVIDSTAEEAA